MPAHSSGEVGQRQKERTAGVWRQIRPLRAGQGNARRQIERQCRLQGKAPPAHIRSTGGSREPHYFFRKSTFNEVIPASRHPLLMLRLLTLRSHTAASQLLFQHHPTSVPYARRISILAAPKSTVSIVLFVPANHPIYKSIARRAI